MMEVRKDGEMIKISFPYDPDHQKLLGHKSSKTTEIYTHVINKDLSPIQSPLDSLQLKRGEDG